MFALKYQAFLVIYIFEIYFFCNFFFVYNCILHQFILALKDYEDIFVSNKELVWMGYHVVRGLFCSKLLVIFLSSLWVVCLSFQVKIQKESEVRLKIIGTRVDATEIVSLLLSTFVYHKSSIFDVLCQNFEYRSWMTTSIYAMPLDDWVLFISFHCLVNNNLMPLYSFMLI